MMGNELNERSLANKDKEKYRQCAYMQISCSHASGSCFIRNTFLRFAMAFVRIRNHSKACVTIVKQICKDLNWNLNVHHIFYIYL